MFDFDTPTVNEIAADVFRIGCYAPALDLQFNYFLVRDDAPLLFTTGYKSSFPLVQQAVAQVMDPAKLRYIAFSHFESDECGALNQWLEVAPEAEPVCSLVSAMVNINDFAIRPPKGMVDGEQLNTGKYQYRFCSTAQLPHGWDAGLLYEETQGTLFCSDLFHQGGNVDAITESDLSEQVLTAMQQMQAGPLADYIPYTKQTDQILNRLADLKPKTLAIMHGSSFAGDGEQAFRDLSTAMKSVFG